MKKSDIIPMPPFFDRYINLCDNVELMEGFEKYTPASIYHDVEKLKALGSKVYAPGKWTVNDTLQHVIDNERIMGYRALRFSRGDNTALAGYDENILAPNTTANERTLEDLLAEFDLVRAASIALFRNMNGVMLQRTGSADGKQITPLALGFVILGHPVHHMNILAERYFPLL
ncbi:DinB family protein [Dyadobacter sp. Leaf189]|uniref:DinB family protein n=1 Tax=Dyadobacter sp. Leaf189 TaxID=1736295 RepID=UPI0006FCD8D1|nr:DinB family protein [Dyadobacter sp. Leaf189]KQS34205.1 hypothetical protein ASG33_09355 [Dyadobacter sp. Leaf189]